jgi:outer membrane protein TolC
MKFFAYRCLIAGIAVAMVQGCNSAPKAPPFTSPVYSDPNQPVDLVELSLSLFEDEDELAERLGPVQQRPGSQVPEPPQIKIYSLSDLEKTQLDPLMGQLIRDFELAKLNDPAYQSALYEFQAGMISADLSSLAYTPSLSVNNRFLENESSARTTVSISQPLFNLELLATLEEEDSKRAAAQATMKVREYELVDRVFTAITNLIKAQEKLVVNDSRIKALENESKGAKREQELGQGTITDVRDSVVRLEQARAEQIKLGSAKASALRSLEQLTGRTVDPSAYVLRKQARSIDLPPLDTFMSGALQFNSGLLQARANQRLAELSALKSKSAYLPSVSINAARSFSDRGDTSNSGLNFGFTVPVNAGTFYQAQIASAKISQAQLTTAQVRQKLEVDVEQTHADVISGLQELNIRLLAIEAAELSLTATEKSFSGGVRTRLDVLNSVQTLFVVNDQYINSVVELTKSYLTLNNLTSQPVSESVAKLQAFLF